MPVQKHINCFILKSNNKVSFLSKNINRAENHFISKENKQMIETHINAFPITEI